MEGMMQFPARATTHVLLLGSRFVSLDPFLILRRNTCLSVLHGGIAAQAPFASWPLLWSWLSSLVVSWREPSPSSLAHPLPPCLR